MKPRIPALKLVKETVRELSVEEMSRVAGGRTVPTSTDPFCEGTNTLLNCLVINLSPICQL